MDAIKRLRTNPAIRESIIPLLLVKKDLNLMLRSVAEKWFVMGLSIFKILQYDIYLLIQNINRYTSSKIYKKYFMRSV